MVRSLVLKNYEKEIRLVTF